MFCSEHHGPGPNNLFPETDKAEYRSPEPAQYIYGYPWHLPDSTVSRPITWLAEGFLSPRGGGVWVDDMYMGTALLLSYSRLTGERQHLEEAGQQLVRTAGHLVGGERRLLQHGASHFTGQLSCCRWARGNGWAILALTDFLTAATELGSLEEDLSQAVLELLRALVGELLAVQSEGGLWHNILDNNQTFLETSSSAMFLAGLLRAERQGWLLEEPGLVRENILRAWRGLSSRSHSQSVVSTNIY